MQVYLPAYIWLDRIKRESICFITIRLISEYIYIFAIRENGKHTFSFGCRFNIKDQPLSGDKNRR